MKGMRVLRTAFTMPELLVVVSIIGILLTLVMPAIQYSREAARRTTCKCNLHQIGIAMHVFESTRGKLPGIDDAPYDPLKPIRMVSVSGQLAPFFQGGDTLAIEIDDWRIGRNFKPIAAPSILRCPSDSEAYGESTNYRYNQGSQPPRGWGNGVFSRMRMTTGQIVDGLAQTAFVAERVVYRQSISSLKHDGSLYLTIDDPEIYVADCVALNKSGRGTLAPNGCGDDWLTADFRHSSYLHWLPPNTRWHDCTRQADFSALVSARSGHVTGVQVLFGDGSIRFVDNAINLEMWRAMGTSRRLDRVN